MSVLHTSTTRTIIRTLPFLLFHRVISFSLPIEVIIGLSISAWSIRGQQIFIVCHCLYCHTRAKLGKTKTRGFSMRALLQRVSRASVTVDGKVVGEIGRGLLVLLGVGLEDGEAQARILADKIVHLRIFGDDEGKMNRSLLDVGGEMLVVSQFTLYADTRRGRRPGFTDAAPPSIAEPLVERFKGAVAAYG